MKHNLGIFERFARNAAEFSGSTKAFVLALLTIAVWLVSGRYFNYSNTWQLVINTGTTIVTFLMVFLIQRMQNKDAKAIHLKLNELVAALNGPSNRLIDAEEFTEDELEILSNYYRKLAEMAKKDSSLSLSHSIEEAVEQHKTKRIQKAKLPAKKPVV